MLLRRGPRSGESRVATDAVFEPPLTLSVVGIGCSFEPLVHVGFRRRVEFLAGFAGGGNFSTTAPSASPRAAQKIEGFPGFSPRPSSLSVLDGRPRRCGHLDEGGAMHTVLMRRAVVAVTVVVAVAALLAGTAAANEPVVLEKHNSLTRDFANIPDCVAFGFTHTEHYDV